MARYSVEDTTLTNIADAIRSKTGESGVILVNEMAEKISGISSGGSGGGSMVETCTVRLSAEVGFLLSPVYPSDIVYTAVENEQIVCKASGNGEIIAEDNGDVILNNVICNSMIVWCDYCGITWGIKNIEGTATLFHYRDPEETVTEAVRLYFIKAPSVAGEVCTIYFNE